MAEAKHYCFGCDTHFRASPTIHADVALDRGVFRGIVNGDYSDYDRRHNPDPFKISVQ